LKVLKSLVPGDLAVLRDAGLNGWVLGFTLAVVFWRAWRVAYCLRYGR
jgi:hypothetical protein